MKNKFFKKTAMLATLLFSTLSIQAQDWVDKMLEPDANFYEIQDAFHQEWDGLEYEKGKGWKQFHRWESFWESRIMEDGSFPMYSKVWGDFQALLLGPQAKSGGLGNWQPMGPYTYNNTNFHTVEVGTNVNIEFDIVGKYLYHFYQLSTEKT